MVELTKRQAGATMIELLILMAVLMMIAAAVMISGGQRKNTARLHQDFVGVERLLSSVKSAAYGQQGFTDLSTDQQWFRLLPTEMRLGVCPPPPTPPPPDVCDIVSYAGVRIEVVGLTTPPPPAIPGTHDDQGIQLEVTRYDGGQWASDPSFCTSWFEQTMPLLDRLSQGSLMIKAPNASTYNDVVLRQACGSGAALRADLYL